MQQDIHFYGVYALARSAGLKDSTAKTIAYQYAIPNDQWNVWAPFHFPPAG